MPIVTNAGSWVGNKASGGGGVGAGIGASVGSGGQGSDAGSMVGGSFPQPPSFGPPSMPQTPGPWRGSYGSPPAPTLSGPPSMPPAPSSPGPWRGRYGSPPPPRYSAEAAAGKAWAQFQSAPANKALIGESLAGQKRHEIGATHFDMERGYLGGGYASDLARNANQFSALNLDRADLGSNRQRVGLDMEGRNVDRGYIGEMQGLADRSLANQLSGITQNRDAEIRDRNWDYGARGSWFTPARELRNMDTITAADRGMDDARIGRSERQAGWDRDMRQFDLGDRRSQLDYRDLGSAERRLDLEAENLGIARADLDRLFQQGLEGLGYQEAMSAVDLAAMLNSNNAQQQQLAAQTLQDAFNYMTFFAQDPTAMQVFGNMMATQSGRNP